MAEIDTKKTTELEERYDPEMRFRPLFPPATFIVGALLIVLSCFHYYTAGFGLLRETTHRGIHLAFVLGLVFLVFPARKSLLENARAHSWLSPGGVSLVDWILALAIATSVLYIPWIFEDLAFRVGNPLPIDVAMGSILVVLLLEATRRAMGWPLPVIAIVFMFYALAGPIFPGLLKHSGAPWSSLVNHLYLTSQGIYGIAVGVVATYVFHFVLFGVLATRIGLGKLFIDIASAIAGRYAGGPAKVSVFASALFGMLSGSSVANAVTVGSLTIPAMVRLGYPRHFAGAVEAASSTGGQITPPIMGAAAFLMIEFLNLPYQTIIVAAIVPAFMHFFGVFMQVHFEAKRTGLRGLTADELPHIGRELKTNWPTLIPLRAADHDHRQRLYALPRGVHRDLVGGSRGSFHRARADDGAAVDGARGRPCGSACADQRHVRRLQRSRFRRHAHSRRARAPRDEGSFADRTKGFRRGVRNRSEICACGRRGCGDGRHSDRRRHLDRRRASSSRTSSPRPRNRLRRPRRRSFRPDSPTQRR